MLAEEFKKNYLNSRAMFVARRWQGKPWSYKLKYAYANYPEFLFSGFLLGILCPLICFYQYKTFENSRSGALEKFKLNYVVVRDDHPDIKNIMKVKERGRHYFPN